MKDKYLLYKTRRFTVLAGGITLAVALYIVVLALTPQDAEGGSYRIAAHALQNELEERLVNGSQSWPDNELLYAVFDLRGYIIVSTMPQYQSGIDIRLLDTIPEYTTPLIVDGAQVGILAVDFPAKPRWGDDLRRGIPALALCALLIGLLKRHFGFIHTDIINPLNQLHGVVERMVRGDLSVSVSYDYDGEMGAFCHDFEAMREQLRDANQRERCHQEKERLLFASLSHDLKTPLASISGYAECIRYGVVREKADIERYADIIVRKVNDLNRAIEDILTHIQAQMHEMSINKEELYSRPLFEKLLADFNADAAAKDLQLNLNGEVPNVILLADPARIAQAMQNIVGNACKYTARGGCITVSVISVEKVLRVSVTDTGQGIPQEDLQLVFEPFFRGEKSRDPNISGSGLGLSIAKYIIERHEGRITCESTVGQGTTIEFSIVHGLG